MKMSPIKPGQVKVDLHMHSQLSHDGNASIDQYREVLKTHTLDVIAITDHNEIRFGQELQREFPERVIVGEEVSTNQGDVIGLFLTEFVAGKREAGEVMRDIRAQGGLVYIPHPFDLRRHGLGEVALLDNLENIDIIETFNARNITPGGNERAQRFAEQYKLVAAYGSDSHWVSELGTTYNLLSAMPTRDNILELIAGAEKVGRKVSLHNFLSPAINKLVKLVR